MIKSNYKESSVAIRMRVILLILLALVASTACQEPEKPYSQEAINSYIVSWGETVPDTLMDGAEGGSPSKILGKLLAEQATKKTAPLPTKPGDPMRIPDYDKIIEHVYQERGDKLGFVGPKGLTPAATALLNVLDNTPLEAYPPDEFKTAGVKEKINKLNQLLKTTNLDELKLDDTELNWARDLLKDKKPSEYPLNQSNQALLTQQFLDQKGGRLKGILEKYHDAGKEINQLSAQIEAELAKLYLHYAFLERYQHVRSVFIHPREDDYYNDPEIRERRPDKAKAHYIAGQVWRTAAAIADSARNDTVIATNQLTKSLATLLGSKDPEKVILSLRPQQPQYQKLVDELARYNEIVAKGGWKSVGSPNIRPGSSGQAVLALKKRLAAEGYDVETTNDSYDNQLKEAVKAYQVSHQYEGTGIPQRNLWPSINTPADVRRDQIALNIKRWRKTNMRPEKDPIYVFVNIPDFNLELWDGGARKMRFAVVVGNNDSEVDEETKKRIWKNRTPLPLAAYIDRVIYNPFWNVTPRIREDEILPEVLKEVTKQYEDLKEEYAIALGQKPLPVKPAPEAPGEGGGAAAGGELGATPTPPSAPVYKPDPEKAEKLRQKIENFPYFNKETGEIDVSKTDKNNIPEWYARNNYEVVWMGPNWEYVRMTQGPHNALGKVKVIFPNYYDVYLHDTPAKSKFRATTRAFSHGCIRMEDPLGFAQYLLSREGKYESENVPQILASGKYRPIFFDRKIPVFLEYYTVRVDDHGRANFLADPYHFDADGIVFPQPPPNAHLDI